MRAPRTLDVVPLGSRRKHQDIAHQIRELAISGRLVPGSRLPTERELARKFQVSRTAIRDAFLLLESQGFLRVKRGRNGGAYLQEMNPRQLAGAFGDMLRLGQVSIPQLLDARLGIETSLLDFIDARDESQVATALRRNLDDAWRLSRSTEPGARVDLLQNLHEFHHLLAAATNNPVFVLAIGTIMSILQKYLDAIGHHTCVSLDSVAEHQAIFDAIMAGRIFEARKAVADHLLADNARMVELLQRETSKVERLARNRQQPPPRPPAKRARSPRIRTSA